MGQAKVRGSYDERKERAIIRDEKERIIMAELHKKQEEDRLAAMTPEQRAQRLQARAIMASMMENGELDNLKGLLG